MRNVLYSSEIIDTVQTRSGAAEVRVVIDAQYDEDKNMLVGKLESFLCTPGTEKRLPSTGDLSLPAPQLLKESVDFSEALDVAKEIFQRGVKRARDIARPAFR